MSDNLLLQYELLTVEDWHELATPRCELLYGLEYPLRTKSTPADHDELCARLIVTLTDQLQNQPNKNRDSRCVVRAEGPVVRINVTTAFMPDVSIECNRREEIMHPMQVEPCVVFEVLSPTTAKYDREIKAPAYAAHPSIQYVVLVDSVHQYCIVMSGDQTFQESGRVHLHMPNGILKLDVQELFKS